MSRTRVSPAGAPPVEGVLVTPLRRVSDERGTVSRVLRRDDSHFAGFGEVYFSSVQPGVVKAWKRHHRVTVNFACIIGLIKVVVHDDRPWSGSCGSTQEVVLGPDRYCLITIPPDIWHGFAGLGDTESLLVNCATEPTDPAEYDRVNVAESAIPYTW
jgi:dTDP-4-dehydrorhamnose 3,5-epimerase